MNNDVLNTSIEFLKGVGPNRARLIKDELKISKFKDLLFQFPYRYCLLYTSPSPRDAESSRMPSSA